MKRVLVVHPYLTATGGGDAVAAWALQALRGHYALSLATFATPDCASINTSFGTSLTPGDFELHLAPERYRAPLRATPTPTAQLLRALCMRWAQTLDRRHRYDVLLGTENAMDFHRRGIHYIHDLRSHAPRHAQDMRWYHRIPSVLGAYHALCLRISRSSDAGLRRNLALTNSAYNARRLREQQAIDAEVLYPPIPGDFPDVPWSERRADFVCVGRLHPEKRWEQAVEIIERARALGHDCRLTLIAHRQNAECEARLRELARTRPWFTLRTDLTRAELAAELSRHRYGLHAMHVESFGIGPAEIQRAGCILFVHASGGPPEIVGHEPRLMFTQVTDAARKIHNVLTSAPLQDTLRTHAVSQAAKFSTEHFCDGLRATLLRFASSDASL